jgi:hypothetical protein
MPTPQPEMEMIAMRFSELMGALKNQCCLRTPQLVESGRPAWAIPFRWLGEVPQYSTEFTMVALGSVPAGMSGVINRVAFLENYPGTMYGASWSLLVNGIEQTEWSRIGFNVGESMGQPAHVFIPLKENDTVTIMVQCPWTTTSFITNPDGITQTSWHFLFQGYYLDKELYSVDIPNEEV